MNVNSTKVHIFNPTILIGLGALIVCYASWPLFESFDAKNIQPIASAVSTISGILFGFVMATITLLASAKENTLVRNTTLTGYLPRLIDKLHMTMGALLFVCVIFLVILFIPENSTFKTSANGADHKYASVVLSVGVFLLIVAFSLFIQSWLKFREFAKHM